MGFLGSVTIHQYGFGRDGLFACPTHVLPDCGQNWVLALSAGYLTLSASGLHFASGFCSALFTSNNPFLHYLSLFPSALLCFSASHWAWSVCLWGGIKIQGTKLNCKAGSKF